MVNNEKIYRKTMEKRAWQGDGLSQYQLARLYSSGYTSRCRSDTSLNLPVDHEQAYFWFDLVQMNPAVRTKKTLGLWEAEGNILTQEQRDAVHARALAWKPAPPDVASPKDGSRVR
jgi:hypothetical protein